MSDQTINGASEPEDDDDAMWAAYEHELAGVDVLGEIVDDLDPQTDPADDPDVKDDLDTGADLYVIDAREVALDLDDGEWPDAPHTTYELPSGHTRAVRRLAAEVAEARALRALQGETAVFEVESRRVTRRRRAMREAATLHTLALDPDATAYTMARWRRALTALGTLALVAGLAWSAVGVQRTASAGAHTGSGAWWFAWLVEPAISSVLLLCVAAEAYIASRGAKLHSKAVRATEAGALAVTITLNTSPYLHRGLVLVLVHSVGPLVATAAVACLTAVWSALAALPTPTRLVPTPTPTERPTPPQYRENAPRPAAPRVPTARPTAAEEIARRVSQARALIARGVLPATPSATAIRDALHCGTNTARAVRDALSAED